MIGTKLCNEIFIEPLYNIGLPLIVIQSSEVLKVLQYINNVNYNIKTGG